MREITKWFNVMIQSWNTIFFGFLAFGGFYLLTKGNFIAGAILLLIGFGGAWFCLRQAQKWNEVKNEDIPDIKQNIWKRKKGRIVKLSATPLRNRPHMVFCSQGTS